MKQQVDACRTERSAELAAVVARSNELSSTLQGERHTHTAETTGLNRHIAELTATVAANESEISALKRTYDAVLNDRQTAELVTANRKAFAAQAAAQAAEKRAVQLNLQLETSARARIEEQGTAETRIASLRTELRAQQPKWLLNILAREKEATHAAARQSEQQRLEVIEQLRQATTERNAADRRANEATEKLALEGPPRDCVTLSGYAGVALSSSSHSRACWSLR